MPRLRAIPKPSKAKIALLGLLLAILTTSSSVILTIYPQHLYIDDKTKISSISFTGDNKAIIKGNQISYGNDDIIPLSGREYIKITGNQRQFGDNLFTPAVRMLSTTIWQNTLFEREIGSFNINQIAQISIDNQLINIIPVSPKIFKIQTSNNNYNIELVSSTTYLTSQDDVMLKLSKSDNTITIFLVGIKNYDTIGMSII